jgi:hypothetical protein
MRRHIIENLFSKEDINIFLNETINTEWATSNYNEQINYYNRKIYKMKNKTIRFILILASFSCVFTTIVDLQSSTMLRVNGKDVIPDYDLL